LSRVGRVAGLLVLFEAAEKAVLLGVKIVMLSEVSKVLDRFALLRRLPRVERPVELMVDERVVGMVKRPSVTWMSPLSYGISPLRIFTLLPNPESNSMPVDGTVLRRRVVVLFATTFWDTID